MTGELRDRVTIQRATAAADGQGGRTDTWSTLATVWARVAPMGMREQLQAEAMGSHLAYRVTVRYRADVTPHMRLSWRPYRATTARTLEIHGVQPHKGGRVWLDLDCAEVA